MTASRFCTAAILAIAILPAMGLIAESRVDPPTRALQHLVVGDAVPPEWAGIWDFTFTFHFCGRPDEVFTIIDRDTLCVGEPYTGGPATCSGTFDATTIDLMCTDSQDNNGCVSNSVETLQGTLSGDTAQWHVTGNVTYTPTGCDVDLCYDGSVRMTRVGPAPCTTPTLKATWGKFKLRYRCLPTP